MSLSLILPPDIEAKLRQRAAQRGQPVDEYASQVLSAAVSAPSIAEMLAPFRQEVAASKMSDEQLDAFYEELRNEVWEEGRQTKP